MSADNKGGPLSRRSFLKKSFLLAAASTGILSCKEMPTLRGRTFTGGIVGANIKAGHMLLERKILPSGAAEKTGIVIVGGGIAGLSAARELKKNRFEDFVMLELEGAVGGNSISGANTVSAYPWGAHYIPLPGEDAVFVRELFEEFGIIEGYDRKGLPIYNEFYLCADPQERLFIHGRWQEGLVPQLGIPEKDRRQYDEFFGAMKKFRNSKGRDGRRAFSIPLELSSKDNRFIKYDTITMSRFMSDNGWNSEYLNWYVDYCCRDDYGCTMRNTSAWAGIHYFASRYGRASNADPSAVLTWPEGNGWLVNKIRAGIKDLIRCNACVVNIENTGDNVAVDYYDLKSKTITRIIAKAVIYAAPRFTAYKAIADFRSGLPSYSDKLSYAPWMIANITLKANLDGKGAPLAWDNVNYKSDGLGYIVANHQNITLHRDKTVITYYHPLTEDNPAEERRKALKTTYEAWAGKIIKNLSLMHQGIESAIEKIDVWVWGHAMVRPLPGLIWGEARREVLRPHGKIFFAHSDMSGISIFEEAQYRGITASKRALKEIKA
ncbi:MAG: FAD-dependent oxidoreductase [Nitrospirae bacterium]|nr:MAG: FAD-dependent oxidoreductase [Nitrospirota bacterium]